MKSMPGKVKEASSAQPPVEKEAETAFDRENRIRERAYWIWLREGLPDGRQQDHWRQAQSEIDSEDTPKTA